MKEYEKLAYDTLGVEPVNFNLNDEGDYVLATYSDNQDNQPGITILKYAVIDLSDNQVVKQEIIPSGSVSWEEAYTIKIVSPPGIPKDSGETIDDYTSFYNIKTGQSKNKKEVSN